jgi:EmrB/QacA subfamily drug resistance transporter
MIAEASKVPEVRLNWIVQFGLLAGPFLSMVDSNIVNVAVPDIARGFHTGVNSVQWTVSGYLLALGAALAASAYLAKRFGSRRVYVIGLAGFTLASVLCALAPAVRPLILFRVLQGLAAAPLVPIAMSMLMGPSGAGRRIPAAAGILLFLAPAMGPTLGGFLIAGFGWPAIFLINLPFGLAGIAGALQIDDRTAPPPDPNARFDPVGLVLLGLGLTLTLYGISEGPQEGWWSVQVLPFWSVGAALIVLYVLWAVRQPHPALDLKLLKDGQAALAVSLSVIGSVILFSLLFFIPVFMQQLQGVSALDAGLVLVPQGGVMGLGTLVGNRMIAMGRVRSSAGAGMAILVVSTGALLLLDASTPGWLIALILSGRGLALGLIIQPLLMTMMGRLPAGELPDANTLFNVGQRLGASFGIAILATFLQVREQARIVPVLRSAGLVLRPGTAGLKTAIIPGTIKDRLVAGAVAAYHDTFVLLVLLALIGLGLTLLIRDGESDLITADAQIR